MRSFSIMVLTLVFGLFSYQTYSQTSELQKIDVYGAGNIVSVPDRFSFSLSLEQKGQQASDLNLQLTEKTNQVVQALKSVGVENKAIQALQVQFNPWVEYKGQTRLQKGFVLTRRVTVTLDDLKKYEQAIDAVLGIGVTTISGFNASNSQAEVLYESALTEALKHAKQKATDMANVLGLKLSHVVSISEQSSGQVAPMPMRSMQLKNTESYQPGEMSTQARVRVVFAIQNKSQD